MEEQEELIINWLFEDEGLKVGPYRMKTLIQRRFHDSRDPLLSSLLKLSPKKIKRIYHRYNLKRKKIRSYTWAKVQVHYYKSLACFEKMHFDTKHILD